MNFKSCLIVLVVLNLSACATTNNGARTSLQQREMQSSNLDKQDATSMAASTIAPVTY